MQNIKDMTTVRKGQIYLKRYHMQKAEKVVDSDSILQRPKRTELFQFEFGSVGLNF